jgi:hypothetical protein
MSPDGLPSGIQNFLSWQAKHYSQKEPEDAPPTVGPFITISREYGCEGIPLARKLAERLNKSSPGPTPWVVMEKEVIETIAKKEGAAAEFVDALSHTRRGYIRQTVEVLFGQRPTEYQAYEKLAEALLSIAEAGRVILVGRGGSIVCAGMERGMHIRLMASVQWRAGKISQERGITTGEAESIATSEEKVREGFVRDFTGKEVSDFHNYDFVFNNERNPIDVIVDMVMTATQKKGFL